MSSSSNTLIHETRQKIDEDLERLQVSVLSLKARRNALAPIARLPPEALALIFSFVSATPDDYSIGTFVSRVRKLSWLKVTHVCHQWREVALAYPRLWGHISFSSITCTSEMLARSKMAPLHIDENLSGFRSRSRLPAVELSLAHISRVSEL